MKKSIIILVLFLCTASTQAYCQQHKKIDTTSSVKNVYTSLFKQVLKGQGLDNKAVEMAYVDFPPRCTSAPHRHPCPVFVYVLKGEIVSVFEGKTHRYKAGDIFYETANGLHENSRNESTTVPARILVFFIKENINQQVLVPEHKM